MTIFLTFRGGSRKSVDKLSLSFSTPTVLPHHLVYLTVMIDLGIHFTCWRGMSSIVIGSSSFREPHCVISILQQLQRKHLHRQITYSKLFYMHSVYFQLVFMLNLKPFFSMSRAHNSAEQHCERMKNLKLQTSWYDVFYCTCPV